jgi:uncharacterized protein YacL
MTLRDLISSIGRLFEEIGDDFYTMGAAFKNFILDTPISELFSIIGWLIIVVAGLTIVAHLLARLEEFHDYIHSKYPKKLKVIAYGSLVGFIITMILAIYFDISTENQGLILPLVGVVITFFITCLFARTKDKNRR